jgi:hypothetical protein
MLNVRSQEFYIQCSNGSSWPGAPIDMRRVDALLVHRPDTKCLPHANSDRNYRNSVQGFSATGHQSGILSSGSIGVVKFWTNRFALSLG